MSGARLEAIGQLRNVFPYAVIDSFTTSPVIANAGGFFGSAFVELTSLITRALPFDTGPDKSGRVLMVLNGLSVMITADVYTPTPPFAAGEIVFRTSMGEILSILRFADSLTTAKAYNVDTPILVSVPIFGDKPASLGAIGFQNVTGSGAAVGSATSIAMRLRGNYGLYNDFAEYDFNQLKKCEHHHYHGVDNRPEVDMTPV